MAIRIAIIGPADFIDNITLLAGQIKDIEIIPYAYDRPQEANQLTKKIKPCDIVFYSGGLPYCFSSEARKNLSVPAVHLKQDAMVVAVSLLSIITRKNYRLSDISMDLFDAASLESVLADIQSSNQSPYVIDYTQMLQGNFDAQTVVDFHKELYETGKTSIALTSIYSVYDQLVELGIPAQRMTDPSQAMVQGLREAKAKAEMRKMNSATVAVVYIVSSALPDQESLHHFSKNINASVQQGEKSVSLFSTRGNIEKILNSDRLKEFLSRLTEPAAIGIGYGNTAADAEQNARAAHRFAAKDALRCGYLLTESKELIGPIPKNSKVQRLVNDDPELLELAKAIKMSPANLSKIINFSQSRHSLQFTAADLSEYMEITRRSAERMIKKLVDQGAIKVVGEEMTYLQGRPRALYELNIPVYQ